MARTIRRKNAIQYHYKWVLRVSAKQKGRWKTELVSPKSSAGRRALAKYHSDAGFGDYKHKSPPRWYRRRCNKKLFAFEQRQLYNWIKNPTQTEVAARRLIRNASWFW